ncbi:MAG TPA: bifunctional diaminohydroxyphosphoribosylaminopyrimidine deaminase/5-amino-6-(5-phosphoribosylamino)uracil reductase RibD [Oceanospirillaceae bacterium]|nr:bifunctional diaminohydroxyphosphoribosylaminopyrimidine deaminase/5-amino-6-(5-phosphoribosylamino)uracil reductase RibD [Oceanospirillaceae bacterium]
MINHQDYMQLALDQARLAWGIAKPNPAVGCVLVRDGVLIAQGHTQEAGGPHAEVMALNAADGQAQGATAYVTLEPCSHFGRTPPCSQGLIEAGVATVVYGCQDPNPQVAGQGLQQLLAAGIDVIGPVLEAQCQAVNPGFMHFMATGKPYVFSKLACSLDGRTAMATGQSQWITGPAARAQVHLMRAQSCAVVTGLGSMLADNPSMNSRATELLAAGVPAEQVARMKQPLRVIIDAPLRTPLDAQLFTLPGPVLLLTTNDDADAYAAYQEQGVEVQRVASEMTGPKAGKIHLQAAIDVLAQRGCQQIMLEAGASLNASFMRAGLLDNLQVFVAPKFLGATGLPLFNQAHEKLADAWQGRFQQFDKVGEDLLISVDL